MKNVFIILFLVFVVVTYTACTKNSDSSVVSIPENKQAYVQLVHACPALPGIKLWQGELALQPVGNYYKSNTHYIPVIAGNENIHIKRSANNVLLASYSNQIARNQYYSLFAACDSLNNFIPLLIPDNPLPDVASKAQLRILNILSRYETIEVTINEQVYEYLNARQASPFEYYEPGKILVSVKNKQTDSYFMKNVLLSLDAGRNYTLYINGFSDKTGAYGPDAILMVNH